MVEDVFGDLSQDVDVFRYLLGVRGDRIFFKLFGLTGKF